MKICHLHFSWFFYLIRAVEFFAGRFEMKCAHPVHPLLARSGESRTSPIVKTTQIVYLTDQNRHIWLNAFSQTAAGLTYLTDFIGFQETYNYWHKYCLFIYVRKDLQAKNIYATCKSYWTASSPPRFNSCNDSGLIHKLFRGDWHPGLRPGVVF